MPRSEYEQEHLVEDKQPGKTPVEDGGGQMLEWASNVGNAGVQRIARSAAGRRVGPGALPSATGALARQVDEEEEAEAGGGAATAEMAPEPAPEAEAAEAAAPEAEGGAEPELEEETE